MRALFWLTVVSSHLLVFGCAPSGAITSNDMGQVETRIPVAQVVLREPIAERTRIAIPAGLYAIRIDVPSLTAVVDGAGSRTAAVAGADGYEVCVSDFFPAPPLAITEITANGDNLNLEYLIEHPFAAPTNLNAPPSGINRADLSIAGRCLFLVDTLDGPNNTYFSNVVCNTDTLQNADGYYQPGPLLDLTDFEANAFPFMLLCDERKDPRTDAVTGLPISNGGIDTGNYDPATGWQRGNMGNNRNGWTGYGVMAQGQSCANSIDLYLPGVQTFDLNMAIIAYYNDPRGGVTSSQRRNNRLPSATPNTNNFFYSMPDNASVAESLYAICENDMAGCGGGGLGGVLVTVRAVDWQYQSGAMAPTVAACIPNVTGDRDFFDEFGPVTAGTGLPSDPLVFARAVFRTCPLTIVGTHTGLARFHDNGPWYSGINHLSCDLQARPDGGGTCYAAFKVTVTPP